MPILRDCFAEVDRLYPGLNYYRRRHEALRRFFGVLVEDVIGFAQVRLTEIAPQTVEDVRAAGQTVIRFSDAVFGDLKVIRAFLFERMYRAPEVIRMRAQVTQMSSIRSFRFSWPTRTTCRNSGARTWPRPRPRQALARMVSDYIAGMTDRFALQEHARLIGGPERSGLRRVSLCSRSGHAGLAGRPARVPPRFPGHPAAR